MGQANITPANTFLHFKEILEEHMAEGREAEEKLLREAIIQLAETYKEEIEFLPDDLKAWVKEVQRDTWLLD